jgi:hypothetical protein
MNIVMNYIALQEKFFSFGFCFGQEKNLKLRSSEVFVFLGLSDKYKSQNSILKGTAACDF